ncbi:MAG: hypothetical protein HY959_09615 [Ignavibacteriae bacterium]|nr:hypothetical protein [Ignavibacteriota bacterium]
MIDHQIIDILKALSEEEIKQFRKFLASPYFNRSRNVNSMFEILVKFYPDFNSDKLSKEFISSKLFGQGKFNDSTIRNLLSDLVNSSELFLMQENFRKSALLSFDYLLKELREKKLADVFLRNSEKLNNRYSELKNVDSEYYLAKHKIELNKFNFSAVNEKIMDNKVADEHLNELYLSGIYITVHYVIEIISLYLASIFYSINYNRPIENNFLKKAIKLVNLEDLQSLLSQTEHSFMINIYISLMKMFENMESDDAYYEYKNLVRAHSSKMDKDEAWFHYNNMVNYCTLRQIQSGDHSSDKYNLEMFEINEEILSNEYYTNKKVNYLRYEFFREILQLGLRLKKMNWVENFIINYGPKLHKSDKENMMNLAYTYLYYEKGDYLKSWKYLNKIKIDSFIYKYDLKNYALKLYYEMGHYEEALMLIDSYKKFMNRNEMISEQEKNRTKNFVSYLNKLILFKAGQLPQKHFSTYRRRLSTAKDTISHSWILAKYNEQSMQVRERSTAKYA